MRRALVALAVGSLVLATGCGGGGGDSGPKDAFVAKGVKGSGESALLASPSFRTAARDVGVDPRGMSAARFGHDLGHRIRAIATDSGRLDPGAFTQPYRRSLERRGRLSRAAYVRSYGEGPLEMADRLGVLLGQMEAGLNEGADPPPEVVAPMIASFGKGPRAGTPAPANGIAYLASRCRQLLPDETPYEATTHFTSSFNFARNVSSIG